MPVEDKNEYTYDHRKETTLEGKMDKFIDNATHYFTKVTNRELYKYVNILEYRNDEYVITNKISDYNLKEMRRNMDESDIEEFDNFIERNWGKTQEAIPVSVGAIDTENTNIETNKRRGRTKKS